MATYGSKDTSGNVGGKIWHVVFGWERTDYSISENKSTIYWEVSIYRENAYSDTYIYEYGTDIDINGDTSGSTSGTTYRQPRNGKCSCSKWNKGNIS